MSYTISAFYKRDEDAIVLARPDDVSDFIGYMINGTATDPDSTLATLYINGRPTDDEDGLPDHEMRVGIDPIDSVGALGFTDHRGSFYARGRESDRDKVVYFLQGHDEEFPTDSVVKLDVIRNAITEALTTGQRPTDLIWKPIH